MATKKDYNKLALALHKRLQGKLEVVSKGKLKTKDEWSTMYTPGVGAVSSHIAKKPQDARMYTMKGNSVAVVSDGSAALGLGFFSVVLGFFAVLNSLHHVLILLAFHHYLLRLKIPFSLEDCRLGIPFPPEDWRWG